MEDAKRDLRDIGFSHIPVWNLAKLPYGKLRCTDAPELAGNFVLYATPALVH